jgi:mycoredoxin
MKKFLVVLVVLGLYLNWGRIDRAVSGPPKLAKEDVVLYATAGCGFCKLTREMLAEHRIPYTERDIERSPKARSDLVALTGNAGVPVLLVKESLVQGYNKDYMLDVLYKH